MMAEDWNEIADEVASALSEVSTLVVQVQRRVLQGSAPWLDLATVETFSLNVVDLGIKTKFSRADEGDVENKPSSQELTPRTTRVLLANADAQMPEVGDVAVLNNKRHPVLMVERIAPSGVAVLFKIHVAVEPSRGA